MPANKKTAPPPQEGDPTNLLPLPLDIGADLYELPPPPPLPPYAPPATVEELLAKCEDYRADIIDALRKGQEFVTVADRNRLRKGQLKVLPRDGYFLPKLELFWLAGLTLGLSDGPRFPGEPANALGAVAALDMLIQWCYSQQQPTGEAGADLAAFLKVNPAASEDEAADAMGWTLDRLRKSGVWQEHRNDRLREFYQTNPGAKHEDAAEFLGVARSTLSGMSAYKEEAARREQNKLPQLLSPARGKIPFAGELMYNTA